MSGTPSKDTATKTKETVNEAPTATPTAPTTTATTTKTTITSKTSLTSNAALSLFDQLKNGVNSSSFTGTASPSARPSGFSFAPPAARVTPKASFNTPTRLLLLPPTSGSIGIVQGTKRGREATIATSNNTTKPKQTASAEDKLDINALRSQLYQGARKTATTTTINTATATTIKKRCVDRYDSSESSDRTGITVI
ncbi:hypothetical protein AWZ03_011273 [Drosophila navojoa]|uniref:Uncharacterized protein n=1 Tax=Drosophila navojoa TaxID=7232 RepID=A0A484B0X0_DRONA|nr:hypothetical protein AWZ03_011273 [Drosophila navojoa]